MEENKNVNIDIKKQKTRRLVVLLSSLGVVILFILAFIFLFQQPKVVKFENLKGNKIDDVALTEDGYISKDDLTKITNKINLFSVNENANSTNVVWDFKGWYLDQSFNNPIDDIATYKFSKTTTLFAKWTLHRYQITYDFGGVKITNENKLPKEYVAKHTFPEDWSNADKDNVWKADFDYSNGVPSFNESKALLGIDLVNPIPSKSAYTFVGWYSEPEFINKIERLDNVNPKDITLYAKFE